MVPHRRLLLATVGLALAATSWLTDSSASTSIAIPFEALVHDSTAAAFVTPLTQASMWEGGRIVTYTDVHVDTAVAGPPLGDDVWVRTLGGGVSGLGQSVEGEAVLTIGRPSLVFLHPAIVLGQPADQPRTTQPGTYAVTARAQGQFPVVLDAGGKLRVRRSGAVGATIARSSSIGALARDTLHGATTDEARQRITDVWVHAHTQ